MKSKDTTYILCLFHLYPFCKSSSFLSLFLSFCISLLFLGSSVFKSMCTPPIMDLYCLLLNKMSWWKLESQSKFQIFREHSLFCLVRQSSLDQSTAQEAKAISENMVARGLFLPFRWEWCPEGRILQQAR